MAEYTFNDAVRDRDEAYRLLHAAQARQKDDYERGYRDGGSDVAADWHIACSEEGIPEETSYAEAAESVRRLAAVREAAGSAAPFDEVMYGAGGREILRIRRKP